MMVRYRVWLRSKPGFYERYDGYVDVFAYHVLQAEQKALENLERTYPDRRGMWILEKVEILG